MLLNNRVNNLVNNMELLTTSFFQALMHMTPEGKTLISLGRLMGNLLVLKGRLKGNLLVLKGRLTGDLKEMNRGIGKAVGVKAQSRKLRGLFGKPFGTYCQCNAIGG